jgi:hypothetical protein
VAKAHAERRAWLTAGERHDEAAALLPYVVPETLSLADQHDVLRTVDRVAADGAACWISAGHPERAAVLIEQGRAFLLSRVAKTVPRWTTCAGNTRVSPRGSKACCGRWDRQPPRFRTVALRSPSGVLRLRPSSMR